RPLGPDRNLPDQETDAESADEDEREVIAVEIDAQLGKDDRTLAADNRQRQEVTRRQAAHQGERGEKAEPGHGDRDVDAETGPVLVDRVTDRRDDTLARRIRVLEIIPGAFDRLRAGVDGGVRPDLGLVLHLVLPEIEERASATDWVRPEVGVGDDEERERH